MKTSFRLILTAALVGAVIIGVPQSAQATHLSEIKPTVNNLCLDVAGSSTSAGAAVVQWPCHGGVNQKWSLRWDGSDYEIVSALSGKCLDVAGWGGAGAKLIQWPCHGGANQQWVYQRDCCGTANRWWVRHSGMYMDVPNGTTQWGVQLQTWHYLSWSAAQWFRSQVTH